MRMGDRRSSTRPPNIDRVPCIPSCLLQHVHHLGLEDWINSFDGYASTTLWHSKDVHHTDGVVINKFTQHQAHDFHRNASTAMPQHLEEGKGRYVDGFRVIYLLRVLQYPSVKSREAARRGYLRHLRRRPFPQGLCHARADLARPCRICDVKNMSRGGGKGCVSRDRLW